MNQGAPLKKIQVKPEPLIEDVLALAAEIRVEPLVAKLLIQRGIASFGAAKEFLRPDINLLHDPFLMKDMDKAVERLMRAEESNEKLLIYGDYDVDGTTSVTMVYDFLIRRGFDCEYYIPDRYKEGYGFSMSGVEFARETGRTLIITLDCGIRDGEKVRRAAELGIDVIICDHHHPAELPPAFAVLDPHRDDCTYPYKGLSGCGVGFKFLQAYCISTGVPLEKLFAYLDLVTISIGADIVPMTGENRILATYGLERLSTYLRPGIKALLQQAAFNKNQLSISDVVFVLAPRINAAGRMVSGKKAVELLLANDPDELKIFSEGLENNNKERKLHDKSITVEAKEMVVADDFYKESFSTVVFSEKWHKGVVGIVASRLVDEYYKPAIVLSQNDGKLTGSARSIPGLDLFDALDQCSDLLEQFGGHTMAAGLTLIPSNFELFRDRFDSVVANLLGNEHPVPVIEVDAEISFEEITPRFFKLLQMFEPFGPENMNPVFITRRVLNTGQSKCVGSDSSHLKLRVREVSSGKIMDGIGFGMAKDSFDLLANKEVDIVYTLEPNVWNNQVSIQMQVRDIRCSTEI